MCMFCNCIIYLMDKLNDVLQILQADKIEFQ